MPGPERSAGSCGRMAMIEIAVVGGGPAGLTAALYAARAGRSVTVFEGNGFGGQITQSPLVENYPGMAQVSGMELGDRMYVQAEQAGAALSFSGVEALQKTEHGTFLLATDDGTLEARAVIYAAGAAPRHLDLPGEENLVGRGISYCALCDGAFFANQDVAVAGGGNTALEDALYLSERCRTVTLIHRRDTFRAESALVERAKNTKNLTIVTQAQIMALQAQDGNLTGLVLQKQDGTRTPLAVSGLFVAFGRVPDTALLSGLADRDDSGYLLTDEQLQTKTPGLFAAGDCRHKQIRQLTTAVSDGTVAAISACRYLGNR